MADRRLQDDADVIVVEIKPCEPGGRALLLPGFEAPAAVKVILFLILLLWCFLGVAIVADLFMGAIERITSKKHRLMNRKTGRMVTTKVWNDTIANLTLMALGSSAPEILLSVIELFGNDLRGDGELGPSTIVGSAAFNLLVITAVVVGAIPNGEIRLIKETTVFAVTAAFSVFAYLWILIILQLSSPNLVTVEEGVITFAFFPLMVGMAYMADVRVFSAKSLEKMTGHVHIHNPGCSEEAMAALQLKIRKENGTNLTDDQLRHLLECHAPAQKSRAVHRVATTRMLTGGKRAKAEKKPADAIAGIPEGGTAPPPEPATHVQFWPRRYACIESAGTVELTISRTGDLSQATAVWYATRDGSAKAPNDYTHTEGEVTFEPNEAAKTIVVPIIDDDTAEPDETFYVDLIEPPAGSVFCVDKKGMTAAIEIIDDDLAGMLSFEHEEEVIVEKHEDMKLHVVVKRKAGCAGKISCACRTEADSAIEGLDFEKIETRLEFDDKQANASCDLIIKARGRHEGVEQFRIIIDDLQPGIEEGGAIFDPETDGKEDSCIMTVIIKPDDHAANLSARMMSHVMNWDQAAIGYGNWKEQLHAAIYVNGSAEDQKEASAFDWIAHGITVPWKMIFALVPPVDFANGWAAFIVALCMIGGLTAIIGDLATMLGCALDIPNSVTAITLVALGTSLPDTFASKTAATQDPYADASIGNITGSNSVNVFLGLGLPWMIGAFYWRAEGASEKWLELYPSFLDEYPDGGMVVPAGNLSFSVTVFSSCAVTCIATLAVRRQLIGGELGGPPASKWATCIFLVFLWFLYISLSCWRDISNSDS